MLTGFIWRVLPIKFSELIIKIVASSDSTRTMIKNDVNLLVKNIFDNKQSFVLVISEISKLCNSWLLTLMQNKKEIIKEIYNKYGELNYDLKKVTPESEFDAYLHMIQVAQMDWNSVTDQLKDIMNNHSINPQTFYSFINEAAEFAKNEKVSIGNAVTNTHIRQKLAAEANRKSKPDPMWYANITTQFNQAKFYESMNVISTYNQSNNNNHNFNYPNNTPNGQPTNVGNYSNGNYQKQYTTAEYQQQKQQRKQFKKALRDWGNDISGRLKPEFKNKFKPIEFCYRHHKKGLSCNWGHQPHCTTGGKERNHACFCGNTSHTLGECRSIYK